ncbi:unnamed protein product [Trichobilharzia regenti]|nr:unnamed protein product [Trichobilharzia regenti]
MQLFNILFLNQFNNEFTITPTTATTVTMTTTPESQSTCASSVFIPLPDLDDVDDYEEYFEYLIISEVDVMLLELIAHCLQLSLSSCPCNRQTEGDGEREEQISRHINNTLRLLHTFKNDIVNSKSTRDWCKQKWSYLFNSSIFASMTALKLKQHKCCLKSINVLKDEVFKLSIEMSSQTLNTLTQLMDINVFYRR